MVSEANRGVPTPPIAFRGGSAISAHLDSRTVCPSDSLIASLEAADIEIIRAEQELAEGSRDWWPLAMAWALNDEVTQLGAVIARVDDVEQVSELLRRCNDEGVPVTVIGGRSSVTGATVPVFGGVLLDMTPMAGIRNLDSTDQTLDVLGGTFGDVLEDDLAARGFTLGHWPQSIALSTVGGWLACRGAGQLSNRYGKIEDMVLGLEVVLADGSIIETGGHARAAVGPNLTQLFVGSEGTLGVITSAKFRLHKTPSATAKGCWGFSSFVEANEAVRRIMQRGANTAVLRVNDATESERGYGTGDMHLLLAYDEGDELLVEASMDVVAQECTSAADMGDEIVDKWLEHRNDVAGLEALTQRQYVVDTMEVTVPWSAVGRAYKEVRAALTSVDGIRIATAHQSHAYTDGACLYFTFAGKPEPEDIERTYNAAWDAGTRAALGVGASLSHHHGVGLNRGRFMAEALGSGFNLLQRTKDSLDPNGILNPGKLGLRSPFGEVPFP